MLIRLNLHEITTILSLAADRNYFVGILLGFRLGRWLLLKVCAKSSAHFHYHSGFSKRCPVRRLAPNG